MVEAVEQWAEGERFAEDDVRLGLALATDMVARFGLDRDAMAALNFDPGAAAEQVLEAAIRPVLGTEDHYEVAERAIRETYAALIQQFQASEAILLPAVRALRRSFDDHAALVEAQASRRSLPL